MDFEQIKELMLTMTQLDFEEVDWRDHDSHVQLRRKFPKPLKVTGEEIEPKELPKSASCGQATSLGAQKEHWIVSPMIGTIYLTPSPDHPSYVKVGDRVEENSIVCIVEAMKVMNEVRSPFAGIIAEIAVSGGDAVEFGSKLMRISSQEN